MADRNELTGTAIVLGIVLAVVFGAANAYLGLRVGLTVSASVPAAVISMGVLRFVLRRNSLLENNMVQTIGSAGEALAGGVIYTMPALYLWADEGLCAPPGFLSLTVIALLGGLLGVLFMVPLRKPLVVDEEKTLVYPEGRACADVIRAGEKGARHASLVFGGVAFAVALKLVTDLLQWIPTAVSVPFRKLRGEVDYEVSAALTGVGFIIGLKVASFMFFGALLGWMVLVPLFSRYLDAAAATYADGGVVAVWRSYVRYVGAGAIAAGGFFSLVKSVPLFARTFRDSWRGVRGGSAGEDLPLGRVIAGVVCIVALLALLPVVPVGIGGALLMALFGFFFASVAARMVGLVGSSNNPISGMTIATLVVSAFALKACGTVGAAGMTAAIAIGSVVCIVAAIAGDTAQDLKTGRLLGATPWKQQIGEFVGVTVSGVAIVGVLILLHRAWGFGGNEIPAPQATLMKVIVEGIMGGTLPWELMLIGVGIATVLALCRVPVMPFAIGLYLPIKLSTAIFAGGILRTIADRRMPKLSDGGVLVSAGLIAGEGLCGILLALLAVLA